MKGMPTITEDMLTNVCRELEYRLEICRATNGAHTDSYYVVMKKNCFWDDDLERYKRKIEVFLFSFK